MSSSPKQSDARLRLYGVTGSDVARLSVPEGAGDIHEVHAGLPAGVYTGLRTFHHDRFLWLEEHLERLDRNLAALEWEWPMAEMTLRRALDQIVKEFPGDDARLRIDVLSEPAERLGTQARLLVAISPFTPVAAEYLRDGVGVALTSELRREDPLVKKTEFALRRKPYPLERHNIYEHIMIDEEQRLLEGTSSNFFAVLGGVLRTAGSGVLEGISRKLFLHVAASRALTVRAEAVTVSDLPRLEEAFLTSSTRGLVPIVEIAGKRIGTGLPGEVSRSLSAAYAEFAEREARPAIKQH